MILKWAFILRLCIVIFAVAEEWLLLDIGWFVSFNLNMALFIHSKKLLDW